MTTRPYERTFDDCGMLCFEAELPAFAAIGRRFEKLKLAYRSFSYPPGYAQEYRECVAAIKKAVAHSKSCEHWAKSDTRLERRFGMYRRIKLSVPSRFVDQSRRSNRGFRDYLRMLVASSEILLARVGGAGLPRGIDFLALRRGLHGHLTTLLRSRHSQDNDQGLLEGPMFHALVKARDQGTLPTMQRFHITSRMNEETFLEDLQAFRRCDLEGIKGVRPKNQREAELAKKTLTELHKLRQQESQPIESSQPPGRFRVQCGNRKKPTVAQVKLFESLLAHQKQVAVDVKAAIREMHQRMSRDFDRDDPQQRLLFPDDPARSNVPLNCFRINEFILPKKGRRIGVTFDTLFRYYDEHGCALLIEDSKVRGFGEADVLSVLSDDVDYDFQG